MSVEPSWWDQCPQKRDPESSLVLSALREHSEKPASCNGEEGSHQTWRSDTLSSDSLPPEVGETNVCGWYITHALVFWHNGPN